MPAPGDAQEVLPPILDRQRSDLCLDRRADGGCHGPVAGGLADPIEHHPQGDGGDAAGALVTQLEQQPHAGVIRAGHLVAVQRPAQLVLQRQRHPFAVGMEQGPTVFSGAFLLLLFELGAGDA